MADLNLHVPIDNMQITDKELLSYINNNKPAKAVTNKEWAEIFSRLSECRAFGHVNTLENGFGVL